MKDVFDTPKYLKEQMLKFREMMGNKPDWEMSDNGFNRKIDLAFKGLFHLYMNTKGITDDDRMHLDSIVTEFERRKFYMDFGGK